ncbi:3-phosphoshikimate 1-carboxyvinyltransferase [Luedemannella flava]|uniref:3-phosphoshikimate 1-carboxyvinyltransferase n=2 Tax=Luedemannella flava TaxID=349316 RepID=A0ABP4XYF4_9ACTN
MARALFLAAAADGETTLRHPLRSDDTEAFADGLRALGVDVVSSADEAWVVTGHPDGPPVASAVAYTRDAGTASRFLPALAAAGHGEYAFDASAQMRRRPMDPLIGALRALGVEVREEGEPGRLPFTVVGRGLKGGALTLDASISSQFLTALLLAGPLAADGLAITVTDMVSVPYVEMTLRMMEQFGVGVGRDGDTFLVPSAPYGARDYDIEPDASSASYVLAAAAVTGRTVTVPGLGTDSLQGDVRFADVLRQMGCDVRQDATSTTVTGPASLNGVTVNMRDISDTMPTLAAIAPFATGPVRIEDVYNTRVKECDRLAACEENLRRLGIEVATGRDWIEIRPGTPVGAEIACFADHRIAMSFSITGLRTLGITLDDPRCVRKTFPTFHGMLADLRAEWGMA